MQRIIKLEQQAVSAARAKAPTTAATTAATAVPRAAAPKPFVPKTARHRRWLRRARLHERVAGRLRGGDEGDIEEQPQLSRVHKAQLRRAARHSRLAARLAAELDSD